MHAPDIRYAKSGNVSIAYQVIGEGPTDLVFVPGFISNIGFIWEQPLWRGFLHRLASFSRLVLLDKRGTGLSDRTRDLPTLETRMDDLRAVLDAIDSGRAALLGVHEGSKLAALHAATHPERTAALVLFAPSARGTRTPDYPWAQTPEELQRDLRDIEESWGARSFLERVLARYDPAGLEDHEFRDWFVAYMRFSASPSAALAFYRMIAEGDVRDVLPAIRVPTLVLHREHDRASSQWVAERIAGATTLCLPGDDRVIFRDGEPVADAIERFLAGAPAEEAPDRVLATVLFTDIVDSTARSAELGDRAWRELLQRHDAIVRRSLTRFRGRELGTAGDGFLAVFDGPGRGIHCARAIGEELRSLGIEIRAGLHTGECERMGDTLSGIALATGARVAARARASEVLVSSTVKELVAGSGIAFEDRGLHELKGVPGEWRIYAVVG